MRNGTSGRGSGTGPVWPKVIAEIVGPFWRRDLARNGCIIHDRTDFLVGVMH